MFLINSCSQLVSSTDFSSIREGLHLHISVPSPEVTAPFCLVPSPEFSQAPWYSLPDHLCRFGVRAAQDLTPKLFSADGITGYRALRAPIITPHPMMPPDLPGGGATRLTRENHLPGRLPVRVTPRARPQGTPHRPMHRPTPRRAWEPTRKCVFGQGAVDRSKGRYGNINPFIHSTTPVGLALGPDSPRDDERGPGTLGHPAARILTLLSLLMSAFSLPYSPPQDHSAASTRYGTLSYPTTNMVVAASSVACLSPATLSARNH